ncbi:hypothetical protein Pmani_003283 [Petrolisthes manimaculis]|uniref:Secreted protein n=1 Tax=Petrolisthes manimaculis TaxID=1843537 RepID=A0AAE1QJ93_9EUCA|nr:hypothetical protein Pmani_003283 [Petrolisthes manimaculis]
MHAPSPTLTVAPVTVLLVLLVRGAVGVRRVRGGRNAPWHPALGVVRRPPHSARPVTTPPTLDPAGGEGDESIVSEGIEERVSEGKEGKK